MPGNALSPRPAFSAAFDATSWSNTAVITFGASSATLPTYGTGEGVFEDALDLLNGRGSRTSRSLGALLTAGWTGAGTITCGIDDDDRFYIETSAVDFTISAAAGNTVFGFSASGEALVGGAAPFRRTASSEWTRGALSSPGLTIDPTGAPAAFSVSTQSVQSLVTWIRTHGQGDADEQNETGNLEALVHAAPISVTSFRAYVNDDGYVVFSWSGGALAAPTWPSTTFRDRLGFTGAETVDTAGANDHLTATYRLPGFWVPRYWFRRLESWQRTTTSTVSKTSGAVASNTAARWTGWSVEAVAHGQAYTIDDEYHLRDRFWPYVDPGEGVNLYCHWGDPRRQIRPHEVTGTQVAYDLLYTSEKRRGRLRCLLDTDSPAERAMAYKGNGLMLQADVAMRLRDRAD